MNIRIRVATAGMALPPGSDDAVNAFVALSNAARAGYPGADAALETLGSKMSAADLNRARTLAGR